MSTDVFGLFTQDGEALADRLSRSICADIAEDRLTRRQAMDRAADMLERVAAIDEGVADPDPLSRIAQRLDAAFSPAGFNGLTGEKLREHFEAWRRSGAAVSHTDALPGDAFLVTAAARILAEAAAPLFGRGDITAIIADARPWDDAFTREPLRSADLVLCVMNGDFSGNPSVLCVVAGPSGYVYLDQIVDAGTGVMNAGKLAALKVLLRRDDLDYTALATQLRCLADATDRINIASQLLDAPGRLSISLEPGLSGPAVIALWDGEPIAASRQDAAAMLILDNSAASPNCYAEITAFAGETAGQSEPTSVPGGPAEEAPSPDAAGRTGAVSADCQSDRVTVAYPLLPDMHDATASLAN